MILQFFSPNLQVWSRGLELRNASNGPQGQIKVRRDQRTEKRWKGNIYENIKYDKQIHEQKSGEGAEKNGCSENQWTYRILPEWLWSFRLKLIGATWRPGASARAIMRSFLRLSAGCGGFETGGQNNDIMMFIWDAKEAARLWKVS